MVFVARVGRRTDNLVISDTLLFKKGDTPGQRTETKDKVRIEYDYVFELDFPIPDIYLEDERIIYDGLTKVIASLVEAGLTAKQLDALKRNAPDFKVL